MQETSQVYGHTCQNSFHCISQKLDPNCLVRYRKVLTHIREKPRISTGPRDASDVMESCLWPSLSSAFLWLHSGQVFSRCNKMAAHSGKHHHPRNPGDRSPTKVLSFALFGHLGSSAHSQTSHCGQLVGKGLWAEVWASRLPWS